MGNYCDCAPSKQELTEQELQIKRAQQKARRLTLQQEQADKVVMKKHKDRILKRLSPPKKTSISQQQLKMVLNSIFDKYDADHSGSMSYKEFRVMMNKLSHRIHGEKVKFTDEDIRHMFFKATRSQSYEISREQFYQIYKKIK